MRARKTLLSSFVYFLLLTMTTLINQGCSADADFGGDSSLLGKQRASGSKSKSRTPNSEDGLGEDNGENASTSRGPSDIDADADNGGTPEADDFERNDVDVEREDDLVDEFGAGTNRSYTLTPETTADASVIAIFLDNSDSMRRDVEKLTDAIPGVLNPLFDSASGTVKADTKVYLVPMSARYESVRTYSETPEGTRSNSVPTGLAEYYMHYDYKFDLSQSSRSGISSYEFKKGANKASFDDLQEKMISTMVALVGAGSGSGYERLLCTKRRFLDALGKETRNFASIILSDEDDASGRSCYRRHTLKYSEGGSSSESCSGSDCDRYRARLSHTARYTRYYCENQDDIKQSKSFKLSDYLASPSTFLPAGQTTTAACTQAQIDLSKSATCNPIDCEFRQYTSSRYVDVDANQTCDQPFTSGGTTYADLAEYGRQVLDLDVTGCEIRGYKTVAGGISASTYETVSFFSDNKPVEEINKVLSSDFTSGDFFATNIFRDAALDSGHSCPSTYYEFGERYKRLSDTLGKKGFASSICAASFDSALKPMANFVESKVGHNCLAVGEDVKANGVNRVILKTGMATQELASGDFEFNAGEGQLCIDKKYLSKDQSTEVLVNFR